MAETERRSGEEQAPRVTEWDVDSGAVTATDSQHLWGWAADEAGAKNTLAHQPQ